MKKEEIKLADEETIVNDNENTEGGVETTGIAEPECECGEENCTCGEGEDDGTDGEGRPNKGVGPGGL